MTLNRGSIDTGRLRQARSFRLGLLAGVVITLVTIGLQLAFIRELGIFTSPVGSWILIGRFVTQIALLALIVVLGSVSAGWLARRLGSRSPWIFYYLILGLAAWTSFSTGIDFGLNSDVRYTTLLTKSGIDYLGLRYLNGTVITITLLLTLLFMLSDPRPSRRVGSDGLRHWYMHSSVLGIVRLFVFRAASRLTGDTKWDIGDTPDHAIVTSPGGGSVTWNDKIRVSSSWFLAWTSVKLLLALGIASLLAPDLSLRYLMITNYLVQTNTTWVTHLQIYFGILAMRLAGQYNTPPSFAIEHTFTFEVMSFVGTIIALALAVVGVRLAISALANIVIGRLGNLRKGIRLGIAAIAIPVGYAILGSGAWVYDVSTPFELWSLILVLIILTVVSVSPINRVLFTPRFLTRARLIMIAIVLIGLVILMPAYGAFLKAQSGKYIDYQWTPAYVPTIEYTRWSYGLDTITSTDQTTIASSVNQSGILDHVRIFTKDAAKLNMRPKVGVNWMSIDNADVDIIFLNGTEYWVSILQLVHPPIANDVDTWRTDHLLLTHSENILAVNAATTESVDMADLWNLTETPQMYYGEGGLWASTDEVYLNIPRFNETHLPGYVGPASYNGRPDYIYSGFWRYWKFFWQGRLDFANGDYGDIKALVDRDVDTRVSRLFLPGMRVDSDSYPVVDDRGNVYSLHWVWIDRGSPHDYADYPEHAQTSIFRLFATVLTNLKTGEIQGYLADTQRNDYVLSFYRSMYPRWAQPMPAWLVPQLRYPEEFFNTQQDVNNFYFQEDPLLWQRNAFLESTEETRYIITPVNGHL